MYVKPLILKLMIQIYNFTDFYHFKRWGPNLHNGVKRIANKTFGYTCTINQERRIDVKCSSFHFKQYIYYYLIEKFNFLTTKLTMYIIQ